MAEKLATILITVVVCAGLLFALGCESDAQTGAGLGALAGAGIGQLAGGDTESTLIGAAVGGLALVILWRLSRQEMNTVTVNMKNSNGSISTVKLRKQGVGYVGPRGEYYDHLPTGEELQPIYGF